MIPSYINDWLTIIEKMNTDNTYKLAWGRALIECICLNQCYEENGEIVIVDFDAISKCMIKYYWNQIFFFKLKQSPYKDKDPVICKEVSHLMEMYKRQLNTCIPIWYDELILVRMDKELFEKTIKKISKTLHENVCWRFKNVPDGTLEIYTYDKKNSRIIFDYNAATLIKEYGVIISRLLNYKWTQLLEKFNFQPKIASKVSGISDAKLNRHNLTKYKEELLKEFNGEAIDFYTGLPLRTDDISVDHVIPWSFMYSDDIWNLVLTSKSNNSSKSNSIPSEAVIEHLKARNEKLLTVVDKQYQMDLEESIINNYLDKYYFECKLF